LRPGSTSGVPSKTAARPARHVKNCRTRAGSPPADRANRHQPVTDIRITFRRRPHSSTSPPPRSFQSCSGTHTARARPVIESIGIVGVTTTTWKRRFRARRRDRINRRDFTPGLRQATACCQGRPNDTSKPAPVTTSRRLAMGQSFVFRQRQRSSAPSGKAKPFARRPCKANHRRATAACPYAGTRQREAD